MTRAALESLRRMGQVTREALRGESVVFSLGNEVSDELQAAFHRSPVTWQVDDESRRVRVQRCTLTITIADLPEWATAESLPMKAKVRTVADGSVWKILAAQKQTPLLYLTGIRWPDDPS